MDMLTMIIADDERHIREALVDCVDWKSLGIKIVASCRNGVETLNAIIDESPDIVMTDIKMPGLSGIELIEQISKIDKDIDFILLSGFREFDFAKRAMEYGVRHYLLKPVVQADLLEAISNVSERCAKRKAQEKATKEKTALQQEIEELYKKQFVYRYFSAEKSEQRVMEQYENWIHQGETEVHFFSGIEEGNSAEFAQKCFGILEEAKISPVIDMLYVKNTGVVVLPSLPNNATQTAIRDSKRFDEIKAFLPLNHRIEQYDTLAQAAEAIKINLTRYPQVLLLDQDGQANEVFNGDIPLEKLKDLVEKLLCESPEEARETLTSFFEPIDNLSLLRAYGASMLSRLSLLLPSKASLQLKGFFDTLYAEKDLLQLQSMIITQALAMVSSEENKALHTRVQLVKEYIHNNLSDSSVSLKKIANQHLHIDADYLGKIFLQETGMKFSQYLTMTRMEKAKVLLQQPNARIVTVAEEVGCGHNPRYFGRIFKRYVGVTPSEWGKNVEKSEKTTE